MSEGKAIVITSGKGGVGKTTTTANLGTALAVLGSKVCLIDADIGLRNLDVVVGLENRIVYDIVDVTKERCSLDKALIKDKRIEDLYLLPAAQTEDKTAIKPYQIKKIIKELKEKMDYILIDSPAGIERGFKNAVAGADDSIVVTTPEVSAVRDADRIIGMLESEGLEDTQVIVNRIKMNMVEQGNMLDVDDVFEILAQPVIGVVPDNEDVVTSTNKGEPIVLNSNIKDNMAGRAFSNIARRVLGEEVEFLSLEKETFIDKLKNMFTL